MPIELPPEIADHIRRLERELAHAQESRDMFCKRSADFTKILEIAARQMTTIRKMESKIKRLEAALNKKEK